MSIRKELTSSDSGEVAKKPSVQVHEPVITPSIESEPEKNVTPATPIESESVVNDPTTIEITDVNPLTGLVVQDPLTLQRRPLAVKISNSARVRPQAGLNSADLVFEHLTEGGITRLTAIYYTNDSKQVGSIRSGRLIDLEIPLMFDAAFAYSGSSYQIKMMISASNFFDRVVSPDFGHSGFYRNYSTSSPPRFLEDTMFTNTLVLRETLRERGMEIQPDLRSPMLFQATIPEGGKAIRNLMIKYFGTIAYWSYDPGLDTFLRWSDGVRHLDASTGQQLDFTNIIVVQATHINTEIIEDSLGSPSIQIQLWGEGPVSIFRNGQQFDGVWRRERPDHMLTFYDAQGSPIPLAPGKSFFQIVPASDPRLFVES
jgi:hypothetical protein